MPANLNRLPEGDGLALAELVRSGALTAHELLDAAVAHAEAINPQINAIIRSMYDEARQQLATGVEGPFAGVPFLIKDLMSEYAGVPSTSGCRFLKDFVPPHDAELVRRFKAAGLLIFGKTNTPEFGLNPFTEPELYGPARNPWNTERTPGGSSGGSGAAIAAGIVPMASGGDGGGSIRIPASCNGLFGLKPTRGRNPTGPDRGEVWFGAAVEHPLTRSVRDSAALLDAVSGFEPGAPNQCPPPSQPFLSSLDTPVRPLRIACTTAPILGKQMDPECLTGLERTRSLLESLGHTVEDVEPPLDVEAFVDAFLVMLVCNVANELNAAARVTGKALKRGEFEPNTWALGKLGRAHSGPELAAAIQALHAEARKVGQMMTRYDCWLTPTLSMPPFEIGALKPQGMKAFGVWALNHLPISGLAKRSGVLKDMADDVFGFIPNTPIANVTGQPSISVPLHWTPDGLPVGMMFTGRFADETTLLQLASQLENAQPWFDKRPQMARHVP